MVPAAARRWYYPKLAPVGAGVPIRTIAGMPEHEAVLFANDAFYVAFASRDPDAMELAWASRETITCIHPGWPPLLGRSAVMESWRAILGNPSMPAIACLDPVVRLFGDLAYVVCHERVRDAFLIATNVFVREGRQWRMVHHQAGATPPLESTAPSTPSPVQ